ncbi:MAG: type I-U CRISPR-associated protein Cas5/Cas6 [Gemmatimonadetes bacterium]|nr:type I-U CRISPR-associated protein Cas5/Cas6 [Gemmatimonadota bacterium]MYE93035.1 type I-U CRISPR-associated protein Cas5/Cas6 [Gemmatimonadota bacterium]MYJ10221.1 type I-U CRISPR-associated protein Cas5/Cas6 [Gemmatimonadota bacterium]
MPKQPTVARYLLEGHVRPRIEHAIKIGEVVRAAAMSKFGWALDEQTGRQVPLAPWQISGRDGRNRPLRNPTHTHAFWLPEDADRDGWIDHVTVFIADGMNEEIRERLGRVTRVWLTPRGGNRYSGDDSGVDEWRLAVDGFGRPEDFAGSSRLLDISRTWRSITPFLASGHLKKPGYPGELVRVLRRRGIHTDGAKLRELAEIQVGGTGKRVADFRRFRSRGREPRRDSLGALLEIEFAQAIQGPLALGYASHFGLGMFGAV